MGPESLHLKQAPILSSTASWGTILSAEREDVLTSSYIKTQNKAHCFGMCLDWIEATRCRQGMPLIKEDL